MPECMVCIEVSSQYCVVCVQYVHHTVCYVFLRVGMIGVCSVSWRYVYRYMLYVYGMYIGICIYIGGMYSHDCPQLHWNPQPVDHKITALTIAPKGTKLVMNVWLLMSIGAMLDTF